MAEELLAVGEETLNLKHVPNFPRLIRGLSSRQLAFFCRVLAMVVFEPEVSKKIRVRQCRWRRNVNKCFE